MKQITFLYNTNPHESNRVGFVRIYRSWMMVLLLMGSIFLSGQNDLLLQNKALKKGLLKNGITDVSMLKAIQTPDSLRTELMRRGNFYEIKSDNTNFRYLYTGRVNTCRAGGCSVDTNRATEGESEYFDYFILYDKDRTVRFVDVFNYQATHGFEITSRGWLKQFIGYDTSKSLMVNKNVDAISGATISVQAIVRDVQEQTTSLRLLTR